MDVVGNRISPSVCILSAKACYSVVMLKSVSLFEPLPHEVFLRCSAAYIMLFYQVWYFIPNLAIHLELVYLLIKVSFNSFLFNCQRALNQTGNIRLLCLIQAIALTL